MVLFESVCEVLQFLYLFVRETQVKLIYGQAGFDNVRLVICLFQDVGELDLNVCLPQDRVLSVNVAQTLLRLFCILDLEDCIKLLG